jgi:beta-glucosidase
MTSTLSFPPGFRWGAATASHQNEGGNEANQWAAWEQQPDRIHEGQRSGRATDWWNPASAAADFDRAADMGLNALRVSIEWSRVEPESGEFSREALAHYRDMMRGLRQRGIEPLVTLHHFTDPLWLTAIGGWENPLISDYFARYVTRVVDALGAEVDFWCTINEPLVYAFYGYKDGRFPPGGHSIRRAVNVLRNMLLAHGRAYRTIHRIQNAARVGLAHHMRYFVPANPASALDRKVTAWLDQVANRSTLNAITAGRLTPLLGIGQTVPQLIDASDYIGVNFYSTAHVAFSRLDPGMFFARQYITPHLDPCDQTPDGEPFCEINPQGMYLVLTDLARYGKPIYVTEHGLPDHDDDQRPYVLVTYLSEMWRALQAGADVRGYYHWTLVDNFEWAAGWSLRFGLIDLDPETGARTPRQSAAIYGRIAQTNGIPRSLIERFAPGWLDEVNGWAAGGG